MPSSSNKKVLLAVCGGIAGYKSAELVRLFRKQNAEVRVVMTKNAEKFVSPMTFQALSGNPVHSRLLDQDEENAMGHINLARWADVMVVAPATANTLAKCAHGLADDLVSALVLAATCPVFMAPAMNQAMWEKSVTQNNTTRLQHSGVSIIGPNAGEQACGETGYGRMAEPAEIIEAVLYKAAAELLDKVKVLITAGPTREYIDPVRFISNRSSGKMGYAMARAAQEAGAEVTLISGPVNQVATAGVSLVQVETGAQMFSAVMERAGNNNIYIGAAAVSDYRPAVTAKSKIKKQTGPNSLLLEKTEDILAAVANLKNRPFTVGFAAETDDLENYALDKLNRKQLDMIAANWVGREQGGFDSEMNALEVFWPAGRTSLPMAGKNTLAKQLISLIADKFNEKSRIQSARSTPRE